MGAAWRVAEGCPRHRPVSLTLAAAQRRRTNRIMSPRTARNHPRPLCEYVGGERRVQTGCASGIRGTGCGPVYPWAGTPRRSLKPPPPRRIQPIETASSRLGKPRGPMHSLITRILTALVILLAGTGGFRALHMAQAHGAQAHGSESVSGHVSTHHHHDHGVCSRTLDGDSANESIPTEPAENSPDHADCPLCQMLASAAMALPGHAAGLMAPLPAGALCVLTPLLVVNDVPGSVLARGPPVTG